MAFVQIAAGVPETLPGKLLLNAANRPSAVAMRHRRLGIWKEYTRGDVADHTRWVAQGLDTLGVSAGYRVAIHSEIRPDWVWTDLGIQSLAS